MVATIADTSQFLSTPSARRATRLLTKTSIFGAISIHALREEGDEEPVEVPDISKIFLSTPSARRATLLEGFLVLVDVNFYPRPPRGGRLSRPAPHGT